MPASRGPAIIVHTPSQVPGAALPVAGLAVLDRAIKQLRRQGYDLLVATTDAETQAFVQQHPGAPIILADEVRPSNRDLTGGLRVQDESSRKRAEDAIFDELLRGDLGFVARHLNKPLSFRFTRHVLCRLPCTPNQVTLGAAAIGLAGCALVASGRPRLMLLGFLLTHLQSVLDGCDGELARVRFQQTALGEWLDTVVDDGLNLALFAAIGVGVGIATGSPLWRTLGLTSSAMLLAYNLVAYRELLRQGDGGEVLKIRWWFTHGRDLKAVYAGHRPGPVALVMAAGRRDFFLFAWLVLAAVGWLPAISVYAFAVATANFAVALGQVVVPRRS